MKNNIKFRYFSWMEKSDIALLVLPIFLSIFLVSCSRSEIDSAPEAIDVKQVVNISNKHATADTNIVEIQFTATALINYCYGENIRFTGIIQSRVSKTTDANGVVHFTRSFNTHGMTAVGVNSGTRFDVIGGAEMFAIKGAVFNDNGSLNLSGSLSESDIVIHRGTLVFENREDGSKVVARHIITKVPGKDEIVNKWVCAGKG